MGHPATLRPAPGPPRRLPLCLEPSSLLSGQFLLTFHGLVSMPPLPRSPLCLSPLVPSLDPPNPKVPGMSVPSPVHPPTTPGPSVTSQHGTDTQGHHATSVTLSHFPSCPFSARVPFQDVQGSGGHLQHPFAGDEVAGGPMGLSRNCVCAAASPLILGSSVSLRWLRSPRGDFRRVRKAPELPPGSGHLSRRPPRVSAASRSSRSVPDPCPRLHLGTLGHISQRRPRAWWRRWSHVACVQILFILRELGQSI